MGITSRTAQIETTLATIKDHQRRAIQVLLDNPGANAETLSKKMNSTSNTWQLFFGSMCKEHETQLWPAPIDRKTLKPFYSGILADFCDTSRGFTMKPEAIEAFKNLGMHRSANI